MTTYFGDSSSCDSYYFRHSTPMSASNDAKGLPSAAVSTVTETSDPTPLVGPIPSSQLLEGLEDGIQTFYTIGMLERAVKKLSKRLNDGTSTNQYLVFRPVTEDIVAKIEVERRKISKAMLLTYCKDIETLIIKVPSGEHEGITESFKLDLYSKLNPMGITERHHFKSMARQTYEGASASKESDSCFRPLAFRPYVEDWPTLVFEVGVAESLRKLKTDARWWLANSGGLVKIVFIFHIRPASRTIRVQKWENAPATNRRITRSSQQQAEIPTQIQEIIIRPTHITGGTPLVLGFEKLFLRQPVPPEQDVTYTAQELQGLAVDIWAALPRKP